MTEDVLFAVESVQARGYVPVPLDAIGDELTWSGPLSELEEQLDQLVAEARLKRRQLRRHDPEYWLVASAAPPDSGLSRGVIATGACGASSGL
jgi:hypothetical protein